MSYLFLFDRSTKQISSNRTENSTNRSKRLAALNWCLICFFFLLYLQLHENWFFSNIFFWKFEKVQIQPFWYQTANLSSRAIELITHQNILWTDFKKCKIMEGNLINKNILPIINSEFIFWVGFLWFLYIRWATYGTARGKGVHLQVCWLLCLERL